MPYVEKTIKKVYWSIGEVADMLYSEPSALRYWASEFGLKYKRSSRLNRMFDEADVRDMKAIYYLLHVEYYTIKGAKIKFEKWRKGEYTIPLEYLYFSQL